MKYRLIKNYFASMMDEWGRNDATPSHGVLLRACNFKCVFCNRTFLDDANYDEFSNEEFAFAIMNLLPFGKRFKFSGGEPTLDLTLAEKMSLVRQCGGRIFLDTNGSIPNRVLNLLENGLVDVLGVSLKGVSPEQAVQTSGISDMSLCWHGPLQTIRFAERFPDVRFTATYVFYDDSSYQELTEFAKLLPQTPNFRLKINNLYYEKHRVSGLKSLDPHAFRQMADNFLAMHPEWRSKMILVENESAISNFDAITFL